MDQPISFEFFPPKTPEGHIHLDVAATELATCNPDYLSVTFGAGGSTRDGTIETVKMLKAKTGINVAPHISCIASSRAQIIEMLNEYKAIDVKHIVALRGDLPSGAGQGGELRYASDLVKLIRDATGDYFHIEVAAYPEIHPQAINASDDVMNLKRKIDAGANSAITQYFFNPDSYFYYLDECEGLGIHVPVVPGIMPITHFARLARFSDVCGAEIPRWIRKRLESYADDTESLQAFGHDVVLELCQTLLDNGAPGLHFYTLNRSEATMKLLESLSVEVEV